MAYADSELTEGAPGMPLAVKLLIAGGMGAGKTTLVRAVTEIRSLHTEELISGQGSDAELLSREENKTTTTVALDFGRTTIDDEIVLYLFGTPGQERFWFMWEELAYGAVGVVILADTRRLADCFAAVVFFHFWVNPFVVVINQYNGAPRFNPE